MNDLILLSHHWAQFGFYFPNPQLHFDIECVHTDIDNYIGGFDE